VPALDLLGHVLEQRALTDSRLPAQDGDATATGASVGQELVECFTFGATSEESHRRPP
jgi:hypothetical protein